MAIKEDLVGAVGAEYISDATETLEKYSRDYSFVQPRMPLTRITHPILPALLIWKNTKRKRGFRPSWIPLYI